MAFFKRSRKGKILKVKRGYNPNSSSVGSQIPQLFGFFALSGVATIFIMHFYRVIARKLKKKATIKTGQKS